MVIQGNEIKLLYVLKSTIHGYDSCSKMIIVYTYFNLLFYQTSIIVIELALVVTKFQVHYKNFREQSKSRLREKSQS